MIRLAVIVLTISLASSVQAVPLAPVQSSNEAIVTVREGCGAGMQRVGNRCVRNTAARQVRRCAAGLRYVGGRCIR